MLNYVFQKGHRWLTIAIFLAYVLYPRDPRAVPVVTGGAESRLNKIRTFQMNSVLLTLISFYPYKSEILDNTFKHYRQMSATRIVLMMWGFISRLTNPPHKSRARHQYTFVADNAQWSEFCGNYPLFLINYRFRVCYLVCRKSLARTKFHLSCGR